MMCEQQLISVNITAPFQSRVIASNRRLIKVSNSHSQTMMGAAVCCHIIVIVMQSKVLDSGDVQEVATNISIRRLIRYI